MDTQENEIFICNYELPETVDTHSVGNKGELLFEKTKSGSYHDYRLIIRKSGQEDQKVSMFAAKNPNFKKDAVTILANLRDNIALMKHEVYYCIFFAAMVSLENEMVPLDFFYE